MRTSALTSRRVRSCHPSLVIHHPPFPLSLHTGRVHLTRLQRLQRCIGHIAQEGVSCSVMPMLLQVVEDVGAVMRKSASAPQNRRERDLDALEEISSVWFRQRGALLVRSVGGLMVMVVLLRCRIALIVLVTALLLLSALLSHLLRLQGRSTACRCRPSRLRRSASGQTAQHPTVPVHHERLVPYSTTLILVPTWLLLIGNTRGRWDCAHARRGRGGRRVLVLVRMRVLRMSLPRGWTR